MKPPGDTVRINKHVAHITGLSRREADDAIAAGRVTVNDSVTQLGAHVMENDVVTLDGRVLTRKPYRYVLFHKPIGYVCSRKQQGDAKTIYNLIPKNMVDLKAVGRLDRDSSGLLLLTDDGDFAHKMTHPKFHKQKSYEVRLDKDLAPLHQQMIDDHGVTLEDGVSKLALERLDDTDRRSWRITMHEGRNRQIRRTFDALGYLVVALHRTDFGPYTLGDIKSGESLATERK